MSKQPPAYYPLDESALLVVSGFADLATGREYREGARAPLTDRSIRRIALKNPEWFRAEHWRPPPEPLNLAWLELVDERYDAKEKEAAKQREAARLAAEAKAKEDAAILERERLRVEKWNQAQRAQVERVQRERHEQERAAVQARAKAP